MGDPLGSSRVSSQKQNREGVAGAQSGQHRAMEESSPRCGRAQRIVMVNDDEDCLLLLSYEKLFEICFYCGRKMSDKHSCPTDFDNNECLLVDRIFEDKPLVCPANFLVSPDDGETKMRDEMVQEQMEDEDGWNIMPVKMSKSASRGSSFKGGSGSGTAGGKCVMSEKSTDNKLKGKGVKEFTDLETNEYKQTNTNFMCTFVYAYPQKHLQPHLWKDFLDLTPYIPRFRPWLLVGDFNNITNLAEKIGGNKTISNYMIELNRFLSEGNLISIPASGVLFTWCNGHKDNTVIYERLDRAIANSDWINLYPKASLHKYPIFGSDHSPILLDTNSMYNTNGAGDGLENAFVKDFKQRFTASLTPSNSYINDFLNIIDPCLNEIHNASLNQPILDDDVLRAVKSICALKSPRLDGIHAIFYQNYWDLVGHLITNMVKDFFSTGSSLSFAKQVWNSPAIPNSVKMNQSLNFNDWEYWAAHSQRSSELSNDRVIKVGTIRWSPPKVGFVKLNFDGSVVNQQGTSGFVIRNEMGSHFIAGARRFGQTTINVAECLALSDGLWMAKANGLKHIIVEGDSKLVIEAIRGSYHASWRLKTILADIRRLSNSFEVICWKHVFREANF
ncbi:hypothetical protein D8674_017029 [Pyrus ussuriensis x Pyrus communis]|uniref:RNase H type-1 domain-containing protein n=1 Tax=Pyrus ussuriensis x Pyrus communis TaxID=2448454 RepID=A0A5N5HBI8_9ROSA|nr:hypothetical protein D8674_017029 [Pyrus ussuriensis x Pyrus communis]